MFDVQKSYLTYLDKEKAVGQEPVSWEQFLLVCQALCETLLNKQIGDKKEVFDGNENV